MPKSELQKALDNSRGVLARGGPAAVRREILLRLKADYQARLFQEDHRRLLDEGGVRQADRYLVVFGRQRGIGSDGYPLNWPDSWKADRNKPLPSDIELRAEIEESGRYA